MGIKSVVSNAPTAEQINALARMYIQRDAVRMQQPIYSKTHAPATEPSITIQPRNVGLILGFYVKVKATITNTGAVTALSATDFGPANILSRIQFTDLENNERHNCPGWNLALNNVIKSRRVWGSAFTGPSEDSPLGFGSNFLVAEAPDVAAGATDTWQFWYWVPLAYSENDYRGAIFANVVNATMQLSLTFNPSPFAAAPANDLGYMATGNTGTLDSVQVDVHQVYLDQLPRNSDGSYLVPPLDLATVYELKQTLYTGMVAGEDFGVDYPNFRDFLSTIAVYYNGAARLGGTDINHFILQSANFTNIWKQPTDLIALRTRNHLGMDLPKGCYYFGSREKPIATVQYGNMQLVANPSVAGATACLYICHEDFAFKNVVTKAGSLNG